MDLERGGHAAHRAYRTCRPPMCWPARMRSARFARRCCGGHAMVRARPRYFHAGGLIAADDVTYGALLNGGEVARRARRHGGAAASAHAMSRCRRRGAPHHVVAPARADRPPELPTIRVSRHRWHGATTGRRCSDCSALAGRASNQVDKAVDPGRRAHPGVPMLTPEEVVEHPHLAARAAFPKCRIRRVRRARDRHTVSVSTGKRHTRQALHLIESANIHQRYWRRC